MAAINDSTLRNLQSAANSTTALMRTALTGELAGSIALVSSFGAESAVLLALAADVDPNVPVLFLETGMHFPETISYRHELAESLGLTNVQDIRPAQSALAQRDPEGQLWAFDPDACCALRKVEPLDLATTPYAGWITGRKRMQSSTRAALEPIELLEDGRVKLNPLAHWNARDIAAEVARRGLPSHPLLREGYASIGCAPCTRPVGVGEDPRAGRWAGFSKTECGIHRPAPH